MLRRSLCIAVMLPFLASCGRSSAETPPLGAALAYTRSAQERFRPLEAQWLEAPPDGRPALKQPLTQFVQAHPNDGQSRRARLYLAWIALEGNQLNTAKQWLALARTEQLGVDADLQEIVEAYALRLAGEPHRAYARLNPLSGRLVRNDDRLLLFEQMLEASLAVEQYTAALQQILNIATMSARRHRDRTWQRLAKALESVPLSELERQLRDFRLQAPAIAGIRRAEGAAARRWLLSAIRKQLSRTALENRDIGLAQRLVSDDSSRATPLADRNLQRLATQASVKPKVEGRRLGLIFDLSNSARRQSSVELSTGAGSVVHSDSGRFTSEPLALITRSISRTGELTEALEQLAGEGAALLAAGLTGESAAIAARFAESRSLPILLLHPETKGTGFGRRFVRVVGMSTDSTSQLLGQRLEAAGVTTVVTYGQPNEPCEDWSTTPLLTQLAPLLDPSTKNPGLILLGNGSCSRTALERLAPILPKLQLAIGLSSLELLEDLPESRATLAIATGQLPATGSRVTGALARWISERVRPPTWYEALGHDLALIADTALPKVPQPAIEERRQVLAYYRGVIDSLDKSRFNGLWTSRQSQFSDDGALARQLRTVSISRQRSNSLR